MQHRWKTSWIILCCLFLQSGAGAQQNVPMMAIKALRDEGVAGRSIGAGGVVTCVEKHHFFMQDETGGIQVQVWNAQQVVGAGDLVAVSGVLVGYGGGIMIRGIDVNREGTRALPEPETPGAKDLLTGGARCQRVRVTGAVHDVTFMRGEVKLLVRSEGSPLQVCWQAADEKAARPDELLDAVVEVTGVAHSGANADGRTSGGRIPIASRDDLRVIKPGGTDIFQRPLRTIASLRSNPSEHQERFRAAGTVTYASPAGWFYFQDATGTARGGKNAFLDAPPNLRRPLQANEELRPGDTIELVGYVFQEYPGKVMPWLTQCEWRVTGREAPPEWKRFSARDILASEEDLDGRPVSVAGEIIKIDPTTDRDGFINHLLTLTEDGLVFRALVQARTELTVPVREGDYVRLDGVAMIVHGADGGNEQLRINLNSFADIHSAKRPLSVRFVGRWLLVAVLVAAGSMIWIGLLRRQVRRQTARLREANEQLERFKAVTETSTDFIAMATLDNKPLYINPAGRAMLGIPPDAGISTIPFDSITTPESRNVMMNVGMPEALKCGHWEGELNMRHADGHEIPVSFLGLVVRSADGKPQYISSIARDISTRRRMEQELRETNEALARFKNVAETTTELVAMASLDRKPLYFNPAGRAMLGFSPDEDISAVDFGSIYTPESMELFEREGFAHAFEHGHWEAEIAMTHRDGRAIPVNFMGLVLRNPAGEPICMSCIAHDITVQKNLEKQLRDALEHERELNQLKSSFVNTISHEFRTPLGIILFAASMLRRFDARFGPVERAQQLDAIDDAVTRMNDLVEQALSLGRAEASRPQMSRFDAGVLCRRVVDEVMSSTSHRSPITYSSDNGSHPGWCDEVMLRAILVNLLGNAVKYSPPALPVTLHLAREGDIGVFIVRDRGPGLRAEDMPKLFTTFHRGSHTAGIPGTGLGLAIVKRCAEALGGGVSAANADDGGALFTVRLPIFADPPTSPPLSQS